ncbi:hypothetical protein KKF92_02740 [Patescibacteria group bacterium]|nr:hypothetical protein [Patescibacteria group bacterium]
MISFAIGIAILLVSSYVFLELMQEFSAKFKISPLLVSLVIIGLGTNIPELVVTISAISYHDPGLAFGNIIGSCIVNLSLVFGLAVVTGHIRIGNNKTQKNALVLMGMTALFIILRQSAISNFWQAVLLLLAMIGALAYDYWLAILGRKHEDRSLISRLIKTEKKKRHYPIWLQIIALILCIAGLFFGGDIVVTAIEHLAQVWQISTTVLGLTLTAVSTSMPELMTILLAERREDNKVVVGTLIGSNIFNLTLFPAILLFSTTQKGILPINDLLFLLATTLAFVFVLFRYRLRNVTHRMGLGLLIIFLLFAFTATY